MITSNDGPWENRWRDGARRQGRSSLVADRNRRVAGGRDRGRVGRRASPGASGWTKRSPPGRSIRASRRSFRTSWATPRNRCCSPDLEALFYFPGSPHMEAWLRLPAVLGAIACCVLAYRLAESLVGKGTGMLAAIALAGSPAMICLFVAGPPLHLGRGGVPRDRAEPAPMAGSARLGARPGGRGLDGPGHPSAPAVRRVRPGAGLHGLAARAAGRGDRMEAAPRDGRRSSCCCCCRWWRCCECCRGSRIRRRFRRHGCRSCWMPGCPASCCSRSSRSAACCWPSAAPPSMPCASRCPAARSRWRCSGCSRRRCCCSLRRACFTRRC